VAKEQGELKDFARGAAAPLEQPSLSEALSQISPTPPSNPRAEAFKPWPEEVDVESKFFDSPDDPELTPVVVGSVSQAALGIEPVTRNERTGASESRANTAMTWVMVAALLLAGVAVAIWQFAASAPAPQPVVIEDVAAPELIELAPLEPVVEIVTARPETIEALGEAELLYNEGKFHEAVTRLEHIVTDDPTSSQAWMLLGMARYDAGDTNGAFEAANTTLAIDPHAARAHLLLATMYLAQGKKVEGDAAIQKYLEADPAGKYSDEARALLRGKLPR
jgi:hypothetical protein